MSDTKIIGVDLTKGDSSTIIQFNVTELSKIDSGEAAKHIMETLFTTMKFDSDIEIDGFISQLRWWAHCEGTAARSDHVKDGNYIRRID